MKFLKPNLTFPKYTCVLAVSNRFYCYFRSSNAASEEKGQAAAGREEA